MATTTLLATKSLGDCFPAVLAAVAKSKADLAAKIAGIIEAQARLTVNPPTFAANLAIAEQIVAALTASISLGLPSLDLQVATLGALLVDLQAQLDALLAINLSAAGVSVYLYEGEQQATSTASIVPPGVAPTADSTAIILSGVAPGTRAALKALFGIT